jgi:hypothetical protein
MTYFLEPKRLTGNLQLVYRHYLLLVIKIIFCFAAMASRITLWTSEWPSVLSWIFLGRLGWRLAWGLQILSCAIMPETRL